MKNNSKTKTKRWATEEDFKALVYEYRALKRRNVKINVRDLLTRHSICHSFGPYLSRFDSAVTEDMIIRTMKDYREADREKRRVREHKTDVQKQSSLHTEEPKILSSHKISFYQKYEFVSFYGDNVNPSFPCIALVDAGCRDWFHLALNCSRGSDHHSGGIKEQWYEDYIDEEVKPSTLAEIELWLKYGGEEYLMKKPNTQIQIVLDPQPYVLVSIADSES